MPLDEPVWWYAQAPHPVASLLSPIARLYGHVAVARLKRGRPFRCPIPVLCVGNFTAGGTGKTPLAIALCDQLTAAGETVVALTRGYGGTHKGPYWVDPSSDRANEVGDEALLLAAHARTVVARDRHAGAIAIAEGPHAATVIVMDDGLQNPALEKDLTIAVVDGVRGFGNGAVIPAGPLRAPLAFQLELADLIVVNEPVGSDGAVAEGLRHSFTGPVLRASVVPRGDTEWLKGQPVIAWAGIGNPERFFRLLESLGADVRARRVFKDHHPLDTAEAAELLALADTEKALLVTTEKDLVRLKGGRGALLALAETSRALGIALQFLGTDGERLAELVGAALHARRDAP